MTAMANSAVHEKIPAQSSTHGVVVDLRPPTPIVEDRTRVPQEQRDSLSVFADSRWDLTPLVQKKTLSTETLSINFDTIPEIYRETAKRLIWCYINVATPVADLDRPTATRAQLLPTSISASAVHLRTWTKWLTDRNILRFADVTDSDFDAYTDHLRSTGVDRSVIGYRLFAVTRAWLYAPYLPREHRLIRPTWEQGPGGRSDVLGPANWSSENKTIPIHPQTMSAMLIWALRFVENFSADILAAQAMKSTPSEISAELAHLSPQKRFTGYLRRRLDHTGTAPGTALRRTAGTRGFAKQFIAWELGITAEQLRGISLPASVTRELTPSDEPLLPLPITGTVDGHTKWINGIDFYRVQALCRHLATAAFIVTSYLTGMRAEECRALEKGCCMPSKTTSGQQHYVIYGKTFKSALDQDGNALPTGADRDHPWLAIAPVAKAVAVMEALHLQSPLLFPVEAFTGTSTPKSLGSAVPPHMVNDRIEEFVDWCNAAAARLDRKQDIIPTDPEGNVTTSRFRRTLAWFIYRKPGGRIALGVQYGHLRGHTTDGYGSRVAVGLRDVFPMEEALARADYLEDAYTHMEEGEQVSGPAAGRYREAVRLYGQEFRGRYMSGKQAAALRANPRLRIYDNSTRFVTCCYDQSKALCHPDRLGPLGTEETPDINHCQPNCGNIARTDRNIEQAAETIARHQAEMASPLTPEPLRARLAQRITALQTTIATHTERTNDGPSN